MALSALSVEGVLGVVATTCLATRGEICVGVAGSGVGIGTGSRWKVRVLGTSSDSRACAVSGCLWFALG